MSALEPKFLARRAPRPKDRLVAFIAADGRCNGPLHCAEGLAHIEGEVGGDLSAAGNSTIVIAASGRVRGEVTAGHVIVCGKVDGDIYAATSVTIRSSARIVGDVHCQRIAMHAGAIVSGRLHQQYDPLGFSNLEPAVLCEPERVRPARRGERRGEPHDTLALENLAASGSLSAAHGATEASTYETLRRAACDSDEPAQSVSAGPYSNSDQPTDNQPTSQQSIVRAILRQQR